MKLIHSLIWGAFMILSDPKTSLGFDDRADPNRLQPQRISVDENRKIQHERFVAELNKKSPDILFIGDSITARWSSVGKKEWSDLFFRNNAFNAGIEGETTGGVLWRINAGEFNSISPKMILLLIGTNNIRDNEATVAYSILDIVKTLRKEKPLARIIVFGILPRNESNSIFRMKVYKINEIIAKKLPDLGVEYRDIGAALLQADGQFIDGVTLPDFVHLSEKGYQQLWREIKFVINASEIGD